MKKIFIIVCFFFICLSVNASIVVMDSDAGRVLFSKDKDNRKLIASTTKIMTAVIAIENGKLDEVFTVGNEINEVNGSMIYSKIGEEITLEDLLYGLLLVSGNDASMTIANNIMKYDDFINEMNRKAIKLGMLNTTFENPHGLNDDTKNYSTAYDLALLMKYAIKNETFVKISSTKKHKAKTNMNEYIWYNKNDLLSYKYCTAGKIGYTKASGQVFVSSASKDNKNLVIVSIDEANKFELHKSYYEKYFKMYNKYKIIDSYLFTLNDKRYNDYYMYISKDIDLLLTESELDNLKIKAKINNKLVNGVSGSLNFYINEKLIYKEKIYYVKYNERVNKIRSLLSFFK